MGPAPAHPRAGVENTPRIPATASCCGSSPCGRGKRRRAVPGAAGQRLIPARAGKTPSPRQCPATSSAHPRAGGENSRTRLAISRPPGSSPRVRGKHDEYAVLLGDLGLIPACAGKTTDHMMRGYCASAHPRACGENPAFTAMLAMLAGSSPRVRGKHPRNNDHREPRGLIPARAGKTRRRGGASRRRRAHPRACGENKVLRSRGGGPPGSSPRVRGKHDRSGGQAHGLRLIPARAGKTVHRRRRHRGRSAHPRACGENSSVRAPVPATTGSSPRVRGKLLQASLALARLRLIPARAGKTLHQRHTIRSPAAHPRACGENSRCRAAVTGTAGSSPRVRGKLGGVVGVFMVYRLIPARAGKTERVGDPPLRGWAHPRACGENRVRVEEPVRSQGSSPRVRGKLTTSAEATPWGSAHPRACGENGSLTVRSPRAAGSSPRVRGKPTW